MNLFWVTAVPGNHVRSFHNGSLYLKLSSIVNVVCMQLLLCTAKSPPTLWVFVCVWFIIPDVTNGSDESSCFLGTCIICITTNPLLQKCTAFTVFIKVRGNLSYNYETRISILCDETKKNVQSVKPYQYAILVLVRSQLILSLTHWEILGFLQTEAGINICMSEHFSCN